MSKKSERVNKLIQLRNTIGGAEKMGKPNSDDKLAVFSEHNHSVILKHIDLMLLDEGIHKM